MLGPRPRGAALGYRRECAYASRCTCHYLPGQYGRRAKTLRRRAARRAEVRQWRRDLAD